MYKRQSSSMFIISLAISAIIFFQMGLYLLSIVAGWDVGYNLVVVCHGWMRTIGLSSLEYVLDAFVVYTLLVTSWKIGSQLYYASRMKKRFEQYKENGLSIEMNQTYSNGEDEFIVISHPSPLAITMGFVQPKIVLSTGLISLLNNEELKAVISHEMYHKENKDPFNIFLMSLCSSTMWYLPILKWFNQNYRIMKELLADEYAIEKQETSVNLGSALLKMLKVSKNQKMPFAYASFADTSVNYRIDYILNPVREIQIKLPLIVTLMSLTIFSLICALFIYALA
ncbi:MAG TPA: M48 family metalloprotease [Sporosarcina psychrophila]|uniref:M48 family metalloprotease n=1 Tax=Sporosarcina psychrophila TaxID=1476 RepID=A0A921G553_SPOPS|nr:M48 family metalloprotease [Sporosarcina psychrophila]